MSHQRIRTSPTRSTLLSGLALSLALILNNSTNLLADEAKDLGRWQGLWQMTSLKVDGRDAGGLVGNNNLVVVGNVRTICVAGAAVVNQKFKLDASSKPGRVTIDAGDGRMFRGIYDVESDRLRVGYAQSPNAPWPKSFDDKAGKGLIVETFGPLQSADATPLARLVLLGPDVVRFGQSKPGKPVQEIALVDNQVTDDVMADVGKVAALTKVTLSETAVTNAGLKHLGGLKNLKTLALVRNKGISEEEAAAFAKSRSITLEDEEDLRRQLEEAKAEIDKLQRKNALKELGLSYHWYLDAHDWGPADLEELRNAPYGDGFDFGLNLAEKNKSAREDAYERVERGEIVLIWNAGFRGLMGKPGDQQKPYYKYLMGYESQAPEKGGWVLLGSGDVKEVTPAEFKKLPHLPTKPRTKK